jgi:hypothetical protein
MKLYNPRPLSEVQNLKLIQRDVEKIPAIRADVNEVALTAAYILEDNEIVAETLALVLEEIVDLKLEIAKLKGE